MDSRPQTIRTLRTFHLRAGCILVLGLAAGCAPAAGPERPDPSREPSAPDGLTVELRESYYSVRGDTPAAINGALALAAPRHRGRTAYGMTDWTLRWRYRAVPGVPHCRLANPEIHLTVRTHLPRWENRHRAARSVAADWDLFLTRLRAHEAGHRERVIREAARVLDALRRLAAPTCRLLRFSVEEAVLRAEDRMWEVNRRYDRSTDYGLSQADEIASGR